MPFCYAPWTNLDIDPQGKLSPCCKFSHKKYNYQQQNIITTDLHDYTNSDLLYEIKKDFLQDRWPVGCDRCKIEEKNNIESKRQLDYKRWKDHYQNYNLDKDGYLTIDLSFGNTCNLKCITCSSTASSKWYKEHKLIYKTDNKPNHFYKENFVEDLINQAPNLTHFDFGGGEPLLSGVNQQKQLLEHYIKTGNSKNISLHYTTNATNFPDAEWWNLWQYYKEVDIQLSLDGIGERYEYIRFPGNWNQVVGNIQKYVEKKQTTQTTQIQLSASHTLSAYNIFYLEELYIWLIQNGLPKPWVGRVHDPEFMRPSVWPMDVKQKIVEKLDSSRVSDVRNWASLLYNNDDSKNFEMFLLRTQQHDEYRNLSFNSTFPEIAEILTNFNYI